MNNQWATGEDCEVVECFDPVLTIDQMMEETNRINSEARRHGYDLVHVRAEDMPNKRGNKVFFHFKKLTNQPTT